MRPILAVAIALLAGPAWGHGAAKWIMEHPDFKWCCSRHDCHPDEERRVYFNGAGWSVKGLAGGLVRGQKGLYLDAPIDGPWWCEHPAGTLRCIFLPEPKL